MVLIALIAVAAAALRTAPMLVTLSVMVVVLPSLGMTELRANRRRRQGRPMSGWGRTVSVIQVAAILLIIVCSLKVIFDI